MEHFKKIKPGGLRIWSSHHGTRQPNDRFPCCATLAALDSLALVASAVKRQADAHRWQGSHPLVFLANTISVGRYFMTLLSHFANVW